MKYRLFALVVIFFSVIPSIKAEEADWLGSIVVRKDNSFSQEETKIGQKAITDVSASNVAEVVSEGDSHLITSSNARRESQFKLRGFDQRQTVVMLDGVPLYLPYDGLVDLGNVGTEDVNSVTISEGIASVLYGPNAMGGVINIQTKKPDKPFSLSTWAEAGEHQTYYAGETLSLKKDVFYARVSGQESDSNGYRLSHSFNDQRNQGKGMRSNSDRRYNDLSFLLGYEPSKDYEYAFRYNVWNQEYGIPPSISSTKPKYWRFSEWNKEDYSLMSKVRLSDNLKLKGNVYYDTYFNVLDSYDNASYSTQNTSKAFHSTYDDYTLGVNLLLSLDLQKLGTTDFSFNTKYDNHKEQANFGQTWSVFSAATYSTGLEHKIKITDKATFLLGLLYEYFDPEEANGGPKKPAIDSFNPQLGLSYDLDTSSQAYFKVGKRSRFPTLKELYSDRLGNYRPNPNLKAEDAIRFDLGYTKTFLNGNKIKINLFRSNVSNLIDRKVDPTGVYQYQNQNVSKVVFQGIELDPEINLLNNRLVLSPYYHYLYSKNMASDRVTRNLAYRPNHHLGLNLDAEVYKKVFVYLNIDYISTQHYENPDVSNMWQKMGGYTKVNLKIEKKIKDNFSVWLRVENLFDRNYRTEEDFPGAGRTMLVGLRYTL